MVLLKIILVVNIFQRYQSFPDLICTCYSRYSFTRLFKFIFISQPEATGDLSDICRARKFVHFAVVVVVTQLSSLLLEAYGSGSASWVHWKQATCSQDLVGRRAVSSSRDFIQHFHGLPSFELECKSCSGIKSLKRSYWALWFKP